MLDNWAGQFGGAIAAYEYNPDANGCAIWNNTFVGNSIVPGGYGAEVFIADGFDVDLDANIFSQSIGCVLWGDDDLASIGYNLFDADDGLFCGVLSDRSAVDGNVVDTPGFIDAAGGDFGLTPGAPARDAGNPDSSRQDNDGTRNDIGAYGGPNGDW